MTGKVSEVGDHEFMVELISTSVTFSSRTQMLMSRQIWKQKMVCLCQGWSWTLLHKEKTHFKFFLELFIKLFVLSLCHCPKVVTKYVAKHETLNLDNNTSCYS